MNLVHASDLIDTVVAGRWQDPDTGRPASVPIRAVAVAETLAGREADLVRSLGLGSRLAVVSDPNTFAAMGERVERALTGAFVLDSVVLEDPHADMPTVDRLARRTASADALIAVGSGTVNDLCKHATLKTGRPYAVFGTALSMNGYATPTASITVDGFKQTLPSHTPRGVFLDLAVAADAPLRMARAGLGDSLCRSTAQVDWLMAHLLLGRAYVTAPFELQAQDEAPMLDRAAGLARGDLDALAALARILVLCGLGICFSGTSAPGSQSEHLISHYIDMLAGDGHPGSLHGEQVGIAALSMSRLQTRILTADRPPRLGPTHVDEAALLRRYGPTVGPGVVAEFRGKALDEPAADRLNARLARDWPALAGRLRAVMLPHGRLEQAMADAGAPRTAAALGLDPAFYRTAIRHGREIRDRFTILDIADDAGLLAAFADEES